MLKTAKFGVPFMALAAAVFYAWKGPIVALAAAVIVFYIWGMILVHPVLEERYEVACERNPWKGVSEGAEMSIMVWVWFSWLTYYVARSHVPR